MASTVAENWEHVDGRDGSENREFSQANHSILMSLLDETQVDECDDERLRNVIQSLEAEISSDVDVRQYELDNATWECDLVDCQSSIDESNDHYQYRLMQHDDLDLRWMDFETLPTSPSWYMDSHGYAPMCSATPFEDQDYGSLWHETNVITMCE